MFFHSIVLSFFIYYLQTINSHEIDLKFEKQHEGEPLIFAALQESEDNFVNPISIPAKYGGGNTEFRLQKKLQQLYRLSAACPPENQRNIELNKTIINKFETVYMALFENNPNKYCKNSFIPSITITNPEVQCGNERRNLGKLYHVGYWVNVNDPNANQDKKILEFVTIYKICRDKDTVIFTSHNLEPGQNSEHKISEEEFDKLEFFTAFENSKEGKLFPKENGKTIHQFVPYDDMIPKTWKTSTLFDINTITVYEYIKPELNEIDNFIRNYSTLNSISLNIYSGIVNDTIVTGFFDFFWYWKIIQKGHSGVAIMVALIEPLEDPSEDSSNPRCEPPCSSFKEICSSSNLDKLVNPDECMFCCEVSSIIGDVGVAVETDDNNFKPLNIFNLLKFNDQNDISLKYPTFDGLNV